MKGAVIREAASKDLGSITKLHFELDKYEMSWWPHPIARIENSRKWLRSKLKKKDSVIFVAEDQRIGRIVGFLLGWIETHEYHLKIRKWGICSDLFITEGYRRQGLGRKLVNAFAAWTKRKGLKHMILSTNVKNYPAHKFYQSLGFKDFEIFYMKKVK